MTLTTEPGLPDGAQLDDIERRRAWLGRPDIAQMLPDSGWLLHRGNGEWLAQGGGQIRGWWADGQSPPVEAPSEVWPASDEWAAVFDAVWQALWTLPQSDETPAVGLVHHRGAVRTIHQDHAGLLALDAALHMAFGDTGADPDAGG